MNIQLMNKFIGKTYPYGQLWFFVKMVRGKIGENNNLYCVYVNTTKINNLHFQTNESYCLKLSQFSKCYKIFCKLRKTGWKKIMAPGKYFGWQIQDELQYWLFSIDSTKSLSPISHYISLRFLYLQNYFLFPLTFRNVLGILNLI